MAKIDLLAGSGIPEFRAKTYAAGGGQKALDAAVQKWKNKNKYTEFDRIPGHVLEQLRREIENRGNERLRRFEAAEPRKLKRR